MQLITEYACQTQNVIKVLQNLTFFARKRNKQLINLMRTSSSAKKGPQNKHVFDFFFNKKYA